MATENKLKVTIAKPEDYYLQHGVLLEHMSQIMPNGRYQEADSVLYRSDLRYATLEHSFDYADRGPGTWTPHQLSDFSTDPLTGEAMAITSGEEVALTGDLAACKPDVFSQVFTDAVIAAYEGVHIPKIGVLTQNETLEFNQPFVVCAWSHQIPTDRTPNPLPFLRILWGGVPSTVATSEATTYGVSSDHPFVAAEWAIDLTTGDRLDAVRLHEWDLDDPDDPDTVEASWNTLAYAQVLPPRGAGGRVRMPIAILVEPRPPVSVMITDLYSGRSMEVAGWTLGDAETAWQNDDDYSIYAPGQLSVCFQGAGVAYMTPVSYPESGTLISQPITAGATLESEDDLPSVAVNVSNAITNPGETTKVQGSIPGTTTADTDIEVSLTMVDSPYDAITAGDYPLDSFRYKAELTGNGKRTPFLAQVALTDLPVGDTTVSELTDVTEDLLDLTIRKSLDDRRRTGVCVLRNTDGEYNYLLRSDAAPVTISIDDTVVYKGYASHSAEDLLGPHSIEQNEIDRAVPPAGSSFGTSGVDITYPRKHQRHITLKLDDRWKRLDYNLLAPHVSFAVDGKFHNVALWYLMKYKANLSPDTEMDTPQSGGLPTIVTEDNLEPNQFGTSALLLTDYEADSPTWIPDMGEPLSSFVQRIHDAVGGYWWEMFFDDEGKWYYQPQYDRRTADENLFTFVETTNDTLNEENKYPIIGKITTDVDFSSFRNDFWVTGMMRTWEEVYGTAPPVANDTAYEITPIIAHLEFPDSWTDSTSDWYVGERRTMWLFNPGLLTYEQLAQAVWWLAYKYSAPRKVYRFRSYRIEGVRPGNWGTLELKGQTFTVRLRTIDEHYSQKLGGTNPRYQSSETQVADWFCDYEVDVVMPWELW